MRGDLRSGALGGARGMPSAANIRVSIFRAEKFAYKSTNAHVSADSPLHHPLQRPAHARPGRPCTRGPGRLERRERAADARRRLCAVRHVGRARSPDPHALGRLVLPVLVKGTARTESGIRQHLYKRTRIACPVRLPAVLLTPTVFMCTRPPDGPANDVRAYVLNSRSFLKSLSGNLMAVYKSFLRGDDLRGDDDVFEQQRGVHPNIYVARLTQRLSKIHTFQVENRKMDVILAAPSYIQERGMPETEIELWGFASKSRNLFSDLVKRLDAAVKLNQAYSDAVVTSVITDIEKFLRETDFMTD